MFPRSSVRDWFNIAVQPWERTSANVSRWHRDSNLHDLLQKIQRNHEFCRGGGYQVYREIIWLTLSNPCFVNQATAVSPCRTSSGHHFLLVWIGCLKVIKKTEPNTSIHTKKKRWPENARQVENSLPANQGLDKVNSGINTKSRPRKKDTYQKDAVDKSMHQQIVYPNPRLSEKYQRTSKKCDLNQYPELQFRRLKVIQDVSVSTGHREFCIKYCRS